MSTPQKELISCEKKIKEYHEEIGDYKTEIIEINKKIDALHVEFKDTSIQGDYRTDVIERLKSNEDRLDIANGRLKGAEKRLIDEKIIQSKLMDYMNKVDGIYLILAILFLY